jgi:hypothetical protein
MVCSGLGTIYHGGTEASWPSLDGIFMAFAVCCGMSLTPTSLSISRDQRIITFGSPISTLLIPNLKNTGHGALPTFFGYHHIKLCGVSLSTAWGVREADTSIWHATPKN